MAQTQISETARRYIRDIEGARTVDWERLVRDDDAYRAQASEHAITQSPLEEVTEDLLALRILTFSNTNCWGIENGGISANGIPAAFTREQDVREFDRVKYAGASFPHRIYKL
jgi:adenine deaminase